MIAYTIFKVKNSKGTGSETSISRSRSLSWPRVALLHSHSLLHGLARCAPFLLFFGPTISPPAVPSVDGAVPSAAATTFFKSAKASGFSWAAISSNHVQTYVNSPKEASEHASHGSSTMLLHWTSQCLSTMLPCNVSPLLFFQMLPV